MSPEVVPEDMLDGGWSPQYWANLVQYTRAVHGKPPLGDFGKLQTLNITHLLNQLARIKARTEHDNTTNAQDMELLQQTLHRYG